VGLLLRSCGDVELIQQVGNAMITMLFVKLMFNDIPHSLLADNVLTVKRARIDAKMLDDLEHAWHRIESDMSLDMQSALGILKEVMSYSYEEPCVAVYENSELVGIAVYDVGRDVNLQIDYTHIKELASFTHKPGIGSLLICETVKIARENKSGEVTVNHGAGAKGFYEKQGFVLYKGAGGETGTLMVRKLKTNPGLLADNAYSDDPTPGQLRYIAALCQQLKIQQPYEEQVRTFGEAGRLIRELEAERKARR